VTRRERARHHRGAILVEAAIVVSTFVLLMLGLVFFRHLYVGKEKMSRLARGAAIAHSMGGCKHNDPRTWLGPDLGDYDPSGSSSQEETAPSDKNTNPQGSPEATNITDKMKDMNGGSGFLNPIFTAVAAGEVSVSTSRSTVGRRTVFQKELRPKSYVTCGDEVRGRDYGEVIGYVKEVFDW